MLEHMNVTFEIKQLIDDDDEFFKFEGMASTFGNTDLVDDIVERGAFKESLENRVPKILWQHQSEEPIGMPEVARETENGLFIRGKLPKADTFVTGRVIPQMKIGSINAMSIGFTIPDNGSELRADGVRLLKKIDLKEISLVSFPANELARVTGFKQESKTVTPFEGLPLATRSRAWDAQEAVARLRTDTGSTSEPSESYKKNFLWFDSGDSENFGAYKMPFVDVVGGKRTAIPRALNNAKARLNQTDIPASDKARVLNNIERYQEKLEDEQPKNFHDINDVKNLTPRELEKCLRDSGIFSNRASRYIANVPLGDLVADQTDDVNRAVEKILEDANKHLEKNAINKLITEAYPYGTRADKKT